MKEKDFKILINKKNQIYIREEAFKIDRIEVTSEIRKSFHIFFNENKYELLKSIVLKIVPEEIKNKYHLNSFLINVAIKMYENDGDKFKRNAKAVGASEEELKTFDDLALRARLVFDVDSLEFKNMINEYYQLASNILKNKKIKVISFKESESFKEIKKEELIELINKNDFMFFKVEKDFTFSLDLLIQTLTDKSEDESLIEEAIQVFAKIAKLKSGEIIILN